MTVFWAISIPTFILFTFILAKVSLASIKKDTSEKMWKLWGIRSAYWRVVILVSFFATVFLMYVLKWTNIITF